MKPIVFFSLIFCFAASCYSENQSVDTAYIRTLLKIGDSIRTTDPWLARDTLMAAYKLSRKLSSGSNEPGDIILIKAACSASCGWAFYSLSDYPEALKYFQKAMDDFKSVQETKYLKKAKKGSAGVTLGLCWIQMQQDNADQAMVYANTAMSAYSEIGDSSGIANAYMSIGHIYHAMCFMGKNTHELAIENMKRSYNISKRNNDNDRSVHALINIGGTYHDWGKFEFALKFYNEAATILEKKLVEEPKNTVVISELAAIYTCTGNLMGDWQKNDSVLPFRVKGLEYAVKSRKKDQIIFSAHCLTGSYVAAKRYEDAYKTLSLMVQTKDSVYNETNNRQIKEMEAKYQGQLKEKEIEAQKAELKKQQVTRNSFIIGFILMILVSVLILRSYLMKKKANRLIAYKNVVLEQANDEISAQRDEIETQRDEITKHRDYIADQNKEIKDSIYYAKRIQTAILSDVRSLENIFPDSFLLFKPRDIVSGDFYWWHKSRNFVFFSVSDCTGHGVPGAFMSMLGISGLNEIIINRNHHAPAAILDELRNFVVTSLRQKGHDEKPPDNQSYSENVNDGIDIALCVLNTADNTLQYAGANNPLYIVSGYMFQALSGSNNLKHETCNLKLNEVKADKQPVSIYEKMVPFTNHELQLQKGDTLYLCSDGYEDQFGGTNHRKFMSKRLKELFVSFAGKPMNEQRNILEIIFENWKGENEQTDDVTILGLRI